MKETVKQMGSWTPNWPNGWLNKLRSSLWMLRDTNRVQQNNKIPVDQLRSRFHWTRRGSIRVAWRKILYHPPGSGVQHATPAHSILIGRWYWNLLLGRWLWVIVAHIRCILSLSSIFDHACWSYVSFEVGWFPVRRVFLSISRFVKTLWIFVSVFLCVSWFSRFNHFHFVSLAHHHLFPLCVCASISRFKHAGQFNEFIDAHRPIDFLLFVLIFFPHSSLARLFLPLWSLPFL